MRYLLLGLLLFTFLCSCNKDTEEKQLLEQAQNIVEKEPEKALILLDSIASPENMEKENYMRYIITRTQARFKTYQDISQDTLILVAQEYFEKKDNPKLSALANYYAGSLYFERNDLDRELAYSKIAAYYANKINNNLLVGKSYHSIGTIYYNKLKQDSAIIYYKKAYDYYLKDKNTPNSYLLDVLRLTSINYHANGKLDSAMLYVNKGLSLAKKLENQEYQTTFYHLLGMTYSKQGNYSAASAYMNKAFAETENSEEKNRISMTLLRLYNNTNQVDSARYFAEKLEKELSNIVYIYTLRESCRELVFHYEKTNNYTKALYYKDLLMDSQEKFNKLNNQKKLAEAEYLYTTALHKKEMEKQQLSNNIYWIGTVSIVIIMACIIGTLFLRLRSIKKIQALIANEYKIKMEANEAVTKQQNENLSLMKSIYLCIVNEWAEIEKILRSMVKEVGATEEPELFHRLRSMIEKFKQNTNRSFIKQARKHLLTHSYGEEAIAKMTDRDLLIFMLYHCEFKREQVAILLGVNPNRENMIFRKLGLKNKLINSGMPTPHADKLLFAEDEKVPEESL